MLNDNASMKLTIDKYLAFSEIENIHLIIYSEYVKMG